ncbi:exopolysaccharide biosynthesis polyprenyl glycosylphosphotransferase [Butyrivibrio sp. XPD2002]|uniref:exopolysaccharide biosynthesis polyprenyl glycosylphosphotransferase n=1 Tax=Butyrivibrio sp. XPD2002 TaxID=1280665 RepID=UPI0003FFDD7F|nr:exopolysaccharide biosynthesis polyprenyl glycosylphosphotransferase [Butyrivibrio sp. XPD2002]
MSKNVPSTSRKNSKYIYRFVCQVILTAIAAGIFFVFWRNFAETHNNTGYLMGLGNLGMAVGIYLILYTVIGKWLHAFTIGVERIANIMAGQALALFTVDVIEIFVSCAISGQFRFFFQFILLYGETFFIQLVINCILIFPMVNLYRKTFPPLKIIEIHGDYQNDLDSKINGVHYKYSIADSISDKEDEKVIRDRIVGFDAVLLNDLPAHRKNKLLKICYELNKRVYYVPKISDILVKNSEELNLIDAPLFLNRNNGITVTQRFLKRLFDILLSFIALIIFSPVFLITAIAIHLEDGGPVFFKQERVTYGGRRFMILKFRSMIVDAEKDGRPHPAGEKDDRITKIGKVIRACRVDELPQLINILKGDMSIVGPRPERWEHVEKYCEEIPEFNYRHKMKGGLTGYAQVYGKYNTTALDKLKLDLLYITNYSLLLDLQIIFETVKILVQKESTEGFTEEASKNMHDADL